MADTLNQFPPLERMPTGIAGLDEVLHGGFFRSGIYMVVGRPGTGKTTIGSQIAFNHLAQGGRALYVTLLTDSHGRIFSALTPMAFFDASVLVDRLAYVSAYAVLEQERLPGLLKLLRNQIKDFGATLLIIDGVVTAEQIADNDLDLKKFLHELQSLSELFRCTTLLLTGGHDDDDAHYAERTMVDGLLHLSNASLGMRSCRMIEVLKHRGSPALLGTHVFTISAKGISVFPRFESANGGGVPNDGEHAVAPTGSDVLDAVLGGGLARGSLTIVLGPTGSGKTVFGAQFLSGGGPGEPGLYFGFGKPGGYGGALLHRLTERGTVRLRRESAVEAVSDILCEELMTALDAQPVKRLFIDGLDILLSGLIDPDRTQSFVAALVVELRARGLTTVASATSGDLVGAVSDAPPETWSLVDSIILLRHGERDGALKRTLAVTKSVRGTASGSIHAYTIGDDGFAIDGFPTRGRARGAASRPARPRLPVVRKKPAHRRKR